VLGSGVLLQQDVIGCFGLSTGVMFKMIRDKTLFGLVNDKIEMGHMVITNKMVQCLTSSPAVHRQNFTALKTVHHIKILK
jgi:hypothetical protein